MYLYLFTSRDLDRFIWQVKELNRLIGHKVSKARVDCEAWGLRKFMSFFIKRLSQVTRPRDEKVRALKRILLAAWFPDRVAELDDPEIEP